MIVAHLQVYGPRPMIQLTYLEKDTLTMVHQLYQVHKLGVGLCPRPVLVARCRDTVERIAAQSRNRRVKRHQAICDRHHHVPR